MGAWGQCSTSGCSLQLEGTISVLVSMDQQVVSGQHEHVGMGTHGERDRDGRDP